MNIKSEGTEKIELFSQGTNVSQDLLYEAQVTDDNKLIKILSFALFGIKFLLRVMVITTHRSHLLFIQISSFKGQNLCKLL